MNVNCLQEDLNISIPIHNCCPISVLRDYQCNVNFSYHIRLEPVTFSDIPCVSMDQHLLGLRYSYASKSKEDFNSDPMQRQSTQEYHPYWPHLSIMQCRMYHLRWSVLHPSGACLHHIHLISHGAANWRTNHRIYQGLPGDGSWIEHQLLSIQVCVNMNS